MKHHSKAFTLLELLCVLAICALVTAIAIPNFGEAKTSSMVAQAKEDMRTIAIGLNAYKSDLGDYPRMNGDYSCLVPPSRNGTQNYAPTLERLTSPIAYLGTSLPYHDSFAASQTYHSIQLNQLRLPIDQDEEASFKQYFYIARDDVQNVFWNNDYTTSPRWFLLESAGPDKTHHRIGDALTYSGSNTTISLTKTLYDPTNGSISRGSIWEFGGTPVGRGSVFTEMISNANTSRVTNWQEMESK